MSDVAADLKERFEHAANWHWSAWEFDPDARIVGNVIVRDEAKEDADSRMAEAFEALRDSVDAIPPATIAKTEALRARIGAETYERILGDMIASIGSASFPNTANEFFF